MKRSSLLITAALLTAAAPAAAQSCIGFPAQTGEVAVAVAFNTLTGGDRWGFEGDANLHGDFSVFGTVGVSDPDVAGADNVTFAGIGGAFLAGRIGEALGNRVVGCPTVSISFANIEETEIFSIPFGFGVGTSLPLGEEGQYELSPYVLPALVYTDVGEETSTDFQISLGTTAQFGGGFYAGASVNRVFVEGADSEFGLRVGFVF